MARTAASLRPATNCISRGEGAGDHRRSRGEGAGGQARLGGRSSEISARSGGRSRLPLAQRHLPLAREALADAGGLGRRQRGEPSAQRRVPLLHRGEIRGRSLLQRGQGPARLQRTPDRMSLTCAEREWTCGVRATEVRLAGTATGIRLRSVRAAATSQGRDRSLEQPLARDVVQRVTEILTTYQSKKVSK